MGVKSEQRNVSKILGELIDKRESNVKYFLKEDNSIECAIYPNPVHYLKNGKWEDIDNTLIDKTEPSGEQSFVNVNNDINVKFSKDASSKDIVKITKDNYSLSWSIDNILNAPASHQKISDTQINDTAEKAAVQQIKTLGISGGQEQKDILTQNEKIKTLPKTQSTVNYPNAFPSTDIQYILQSNKLKENIVLNEKSDNTTYSFNIQADNLKPVLLENNTIEFLDSSNNSKKIFEMQNPIMFDANGSYSYEINVTLEQVANGYKLTLMPSSKWINDSSRVYPITIDPPIQTSVDPTTIQDADVQANLPDSNTYTQDRLRVGNGTVSGISRSFLKFTLPNLHPSYVVTYAQLGAALYTTNTNTRQINVHKVTNDWNSQSLTWNNKPGFDTKVSDYDLVSGDAGTPAYWDITSIVKEWYTSGNNYGIMLKNVDETTGFNEFFSSDASSEYSGLRPRIFIDYINISGLESYWTYHSAGAGRAGTAYVNDYNGNMVFLHEDISIGGSLMPVSINHVFNSNRKDDDIGFGKGWRTNLNQKVVYEALPDGTNKYVYVDEDGTKHYFTDVSGTLKDDDGLDLVLSLSSQSGNYSIKDKKDNVLNFDYDGNLTSIVDSNGNTITIALSGDKIQTVTDGSGRTITFNYANNLLSSIVASSRTISYAYDTNGRISTITYPDGNISRYYYYDNGNVSEAHNYDGYTVGLEYYPGVAGRVSKIKEYNGADNLGNELSISYGFNTTTYTDLKSNKNVYQFNNSGNTVYVYNNLGYAKYFDYKTENNISQNKLISDSKVQKISMNLLKNHNAEVEDNTWLYGSYNGAPGSGSISQEQHFYGYK